MKIHALWLSASVLALTLGSGGGAQAQTTTQAAPPPAATPDKTSETQEVVVTAERRSTNLQNTAIAATVLTGAELLN